MSPRLSTKSIGNLIAGLCSLVLWGSPPRGEVPSGAVGPLEELVQRALADNPALRAQRERIRAAGEVPSQVNALPDPAADLEFMNLSVTHPNWRDGLTEGVSVGVTQGIPHAGKRRAAAAVARSEMEVQRARLVVMETGLRTQVTDAAYRLVALGELMALNDRTREALDAASQTAAAVYASGRGGQGDILLAQSGATRALARREELEAQEWIARDRLASLLGGPLEGVSLEGLALPEPVPVPPLTDLLARLPGTSPEVAVGRAEEDVGEKKVEAARLASKPDFTVGARYRFRDMSMGGGDYLTASVGMTLPFLHRKDRYQPALKEAILVRESARYATEENLNRSRYELSEAHRRATRDHRLYRLYKEGLMAQAAQAYESSLVAYEVGKSDFASLLMALAQLDEIQGDAVMTQADFQEAVARMGAALGGDPFGDAGPAPDPSRRAFPSGGPE